MREKIKKLVNEEFQYELPSIELSTDIIELFVENGKSYTQSLFITTREKIKMKGLIYCTCPYVKIDEDVVSEATVEKVLEAIDKKLGK